MSWIKMRTNLDTDPRVIMMADGLETTEIHVVGLLWKVWSWADQHSLDGNAISVTKTFLDRYLSVTGFGNAMENVGWLIADEEGLTFPNFEEHNGNTAKKRAQTAKRVAAHKAKNKTVTKSSKKQANGNAVVTQGALPREEKREKKIIKGGNLILQKLISPSLRMRSGRNGLSGATIAAR